MNAPHINSQEIHVKERDSNTTSSNGGKKLYLVPNTSEESSKEQILQEQMRQAQYEIARLQAMLLHKEQLLQNFHVREQELKSVLFR